MKMAKASEADLEMAMQLASALEALNSRWGATMPEKIAKPQRDEGEAEGFSLDDDENCRRVCEYLIRLTRSASLFRVVWGAAVMLDPANKLVDPDADTIEHHPATVAGLDAQRARPLADWHEDIGAVLWWRFPVDEPPYCGHQNCDTWPGYHTHWTPLLVPHAPASAITTRTPS
jgi:hypothetical protein